MANGWGEWHKGRVELQGEAVLLPIREWEMGERRGEINPTDSIHQLAFAPPGIELGLEIGSGLLWNGNGLARIGLGSDRICRGSAMIIPVHQLRHRLSSV